MSSESGSDNDWVQDVARWCHGTPATFGRSSAVGESDIELGYEAALPPLQARHWPDAPAMVQTELDG